MGFDRPSAGIEVAPRERDLPLSVPQEQVWFLLRLHPGARCHQFQATVDMAGPLDVVALQRSLREIVARHEIFRTTFVEREGQPFQEVHPPPPVALPVVDLSGLPDLEAEAGRILSDELGRPIDPGVLPLVRWSLLRLGPERHRLLHVGHHLVQDGWAFNVFLTELLELYEALAEGRPSPLEPPPLQFADFAGWHRRWLEGDAARRQVAYWKAALAGVPPILGLPTDRPRPPTPSFLGNAPRFELPADLCDDLRRFSRERGATLFMTMLAGFTALLHRYSGQTDVCVGSGIANRRWRETQAMLGTMANTVALRTDLSGDPTFDTLVERVRDVTLAAHANQDVPFGRVVMALGLERRLSALPVYQVLFSFQDAPMPPENVAGLALEVREGLANGSAKADLNVIAIPRRERRAGGGPRGQDRPGPRDREDRSPDDRAIALVWEYSADLFDAETMDRMAGHYRTLLRSAMARPGRPVSELELMDEGERRAARVAPGDRPAPPEPWGSRGAGEPGAGPFPARSEIERRVTALWEEVLERGPIGVDQNFFDVGGDSLLLARVQARLATDLGSDLSIVDLLQHPTIRSVADRLAGVRPRSFVREFE